MKVLWPSLLLLLAIVPLIVAVYIWMLRRRRVGLRYSSLLLVRAAIPRFSRLRRHLPFALLLVGLTSLIVAVARPVRLVSVPSGQATIMLTIDVSGSMRQDDIQPSRLRAAQEAALTFIRRQTSSTQIGIVAFAGYAELVQPPTTDKESLELAVRSLTLARGTAIGSGILEAVDAIAEIDPTVAPSVTETSPALENPPPPLPDGVYVPHIIVVLTDGVPTTGPDPVEAARQAADRGVRVYTIGFGTEVGSATFGGGNRWGGSGQQFGRRFRRGIDEAAMKQIAANSGGEYYAASSASELLSVFEKLPTSLITKTEVMEISVLFTAVGALLAAIAMALSLLWHPLL